MSLLTSVQFAYTAYLLLFYVEYLKMSWAKLNDKQQYSVTLPVIDAGFWQKIFLKYAELFEAKYAEFGEICGAYMRLIFLHISGILAYATSSDEES